KCHRRAFPTDAFGSEPVLRYSANSFASGHLSRNGEDYRAREQRPPGFGHGRCSWNCLVTPVMFLGGSPHAISTVRFMFVVRARARGPWLVSLFPIADASGRIRAIRPRG